MALPTPLTPSQVSGSADAGEQPVMFNTGPNIGQSLLVSSTDPNLAAAVIAGEVTPLDISAFGGVDVITVTSISPLTAAALTGVVVIGTGFRSDLHFELEGSNGADAENVVLTGSTQATMDFDLSASTPGDIALKIYDLAIGPTHVVFTFNTTIAAP